MELVAGTIVSDIAGGAAIDGGVISVHPVCRLVAAV